MAIDITTIDAAQNPEQLSTEWRRYYGKFKVELKKVLRLKWQDKISHLNDAFQQLEYGEAAIQKLRAKLVRLSLQIAEVNSRNIQKDPNKNYNKLMPQFDSLKKTMQKIINSQAYEIAKTSNMRYLANGVFDRIEAKRKETEAYIRALLSRKKKLETSIVKR